MRKQFTEWYRQNENAIGVSLGVGFFLLFIASLMNFPVFEFFLKILGFINQNIADFYYSHIVNKPTTESKISTEIAILFSIVVFTLLYLKLDLITIKNKLYGKPENVKLNNLRAFSWFNLILIIIVALLFVTSLNSSISLQEKFNRQLLQLTPYVSQENITELKIDWTYINSEADYDSLNSKIDRYYKEYKVRKN